MSTTETETTTPTPPANDGLTETEIKTIVGGVVDEKLKDWKPQDLDTFKTDLLDEVGKMFEANKQSGTSFDEAGFLGKVDNLLSDKLKTIGVQSKRVGPISRWLGL